MQNHESSWPSGPQHLRVTWVLLRSASPIAFPVSGNTRDCVVIARFLTLGTGANMAGNIQQHGEQTSHERADRTRPASASAYGKAFAGEASGVTKFGAFNSNDVPEKHEGNVSASAPGKIMSAVHARKCGQTRRGWRVC